MRFIEVYRKLEEKNEGYMLLIRSGIFFIGVGKTAKILVKRIGLRPIYDVGTGILSIGLQCEIVKA